MKRRCRSCRDELAEWAQIVVIPKGRPTYTRGPYCTGCAEDAWAIQALESEERVYGWVEYLDQESYLTDYSAWPLRGGRPSRPDAS